MSFRNLLFAFLFMSLGTLAFAQATPPASHGATSHHESGTPMMMHPMGMMGAMPSDEQIDRSLTTLQRNLNLTASQVSTLRDMARVRRDEMRSMRQQVEPKFRQLMTLLNQPNPDPTAVGRATIELKAVHDQVRAKQAEREKQLSSVLNPTQLQTVNQLRSQAGTFMALRQLGFIEPQDFAHGMMSGRMNAPTYGTGQQER